MFMIEKSWISKLNYLSDYLEPFASVAPLPPMQCRVEFVRAFSLIAGRAAN